MGLALLQSEGVSHLFENPGTTELPIMAALPDRPVVAGIGDGSAMYSIQALWTAANAKLPITYVVANNGGYRIIKERLKSFHGVERYTGMEFKDPPIDFVGLARSMGVTAMQIVDPDDIGPALAESTRRDGPTLLDVVVDDGFGNEGRQVIRDQR